MSMSSVVALLLIVALAYSEETVKSGIPPSHQDPCDVQALISANNANGGKKFHLKVKFFGFFEKATKFDEIFILLLTNNFVFMCFPPNFEFSVSYSSSLSGAL